MDSPVFEDNLSLIQPFLERTERLVWSARPVSGGLVLKRDLPKMLFGLVFAGFAGVWMSLALGMGAPWFFVLFGTPFMLIGLGLAFGGIFWRHRRAQGTLYALTNRRLLELDTRKHTIRHQLELLKLGDPELIQHGNGTGTLSFKAHLEARKQEITQRVQATDKLDFKAVLDEIRREGLFFMEVADIPDPETAFYLLKDQLKAARQHASDKSHSGTLSGQDSPGL